MYESEDDLVSERWEELLNRLADIRDETMRLNGVLRAMAAKAGVTATDIEDTIEVYVRATQPDGD